MHHGVVFARAVSVRRHISRTDVREYDTTADVSHVVLKRSGIGTVDRCLIGTRSS